VTSFSEDYNSTNALLNGLIPKIYFSFLSKISVNVHVT